MRQFWYSHSKGRSCFCTLLLLTVAVSLPVSAQPLSRAFTTHIPQDTVTHSNPQHLTATDAGIFFAADDGIHGSELWFMDPDENVHLIADLWPGKESGAPREFMAYNDRIVFISNYHVGRPIDVVMSAGTQPGEVVALTDADAFPIAAGSATLTQAGGRLYCAANRSDLERRLYQLIDADTQQWHEVQLPIFTDIKRWLPEKGMKEWYNEMGNWLLFHVYGTDDSGQFVWVLGEDENHAYCLDTDFFTLPTYTSIALEHLYINAIHDNYDKELWRWDGLTSSPEFIMDINPGSGGSNPESFTGFNGNVYFKARDAVHGNEVWRTDGTEAGTFMLKDINPGRLDSNPYSFFVLGDTMLFLAYTERHGNELWRTDGTKAGTQFVQDIYPGAGSSNLYEMTVLGDQLLFAAHHPVHGEELWRSDGTPEGTYLIKDIYPGEAISEPFHFETFRGKLYFSADNGTQGRELWVSDGTPENTRMIADIYPSSRVIRSADPKQLTCTKAGAYFVADDITHGAELWWSHEDTDETVLVADIHPGPAHADPTYLTRVHETLFFAANDGSHGVELWRAEGEGDGVQLIADIQPGSEGSYPKQLLDVNGTLLFEASPAKNDPYLYKLAPPYDKPVPLLQRNKLLPDASLLSIRQIQDRVIAVYRDSAAHLRFLEALSNLSEFTLLPISLPSQPRWNDFLDAATGDSLSSTQLLYCYFALPGMENRYTWLSGTAYFNAYSPETGAELWHSNHGALEAKLFKDCFPGPASSSPDLLLATFGNKLFFAAEHIGMGREIWYSDGTPAGTYIVSDGMSGAVGIDPRSIIEFSYIVFIISRDDVYQRYSFHAYNYNAISDTYHGINQKDGYIFSNLNVRTLSGATDYLYIVGDNPAIGRELWRYSMDDRHILPVANILKEEGYSQYIPIRNDLTYHIR